ncbi:uncharacterized protein P884DRAFT_260733 [Thermothelomyces heterothallicus CBS 202.75]|uniref:uncharacterized protein n=1 Tax=Thermothelomyces heterothallicus CBS 202.75 TaxID=1149848 RepID=UPI0037427251
MAQQQSLSSNNPFRRKAVSSAPAAPPAAVPRFADLDESPGPTPGVEPDLPPADLFRHQLQSLSASTEPPPETSFRKPKVVKKVRVQSPPSSPDSSGVPQQFPSASSDEDDSSIGPSDETGNHEDPFDRASSTDSADVSDKGEDDPQSLPAYRTPPNPFEKTLRDLNVGPAGSEKKGPERTSGTRGVLDVDAFGRLLLTGQAGGAASSQVASPFITEHAKHPPAPNSNGATARDATSAPRSPSSGALQVAQDTPQLSREALEHAGQSDGRGSVSSVQPSTLPNVQTTPPPHPKKKPPPPSSRHGKLINPGPAGAAAESKPTAGGGAQGPVNSPGRRATTSLTPASPSSPHSANRSLSSASQESPAEEASNSVLDREAAGKLLGPEIQPGLNIVMPPRPPTPPNASHATVVTGTQSSRKPAPPPRRQPHVRSGSKTASGAVSAVQHDDPELPVRRSSVDSTRSRSSAAARVGAHPPAPPPPRRPSHASRGSISYGLPPPSPTAPSEDSEPIFLSGAPIVSSPTTVSDSPDGSGSSTPAPAQPPATAAPGTKPVPPPPPPPARNASVRGKRPASRTVPASPSSSSPDASGLTRRSSGSGNRGKEPPPPPARHRDRGNSRGSVESAAAASGWAESQQPVPGAERSVDSDPAGMESHAGEILADLNALQREVDALRGQVEKAG